ncbi:MAG: phosphate ABC transporter substrate-binding protein [Nitrospiraceae bacterium]|nr:phosphate ABC transporter substrate-binding protein [Nitrospiraceae bacterium]
MQVRYGILISVIVCGLFVYPPCSRAAALTGSGCSVSTVGYLSDLSKEYEKETGVRMHIIGGGSLSGLTALGAQKVDFAASCLGPSPVNARNYQYVRVAWDALVFIVHKSNPVNNITPEKVADIYSGAITNWKQLGGKNGEIKSFISAAGSMGGIGESLSKMVLKGREVTPERNSSIQASSVAIWEQLVEKTPGGFASTGFSSAKKRNVKMLKVNGVSPTKQNIMTDKYPLRRPLYIVVPKDPQPEVKKFVEYVLGRKGQSLIKSYGMVSLSEAR